MLVEPIAWIAFETKKPREQQKVVFLPKRESTWYQLGIYHSRAEGIGFPSYLVQISSREKEYISCENTIWASFEVYDLFFKKYLSETR